VRKLAVLIFRMGEIIMAMVTQVLQPTPQFIYLLHHVTRMVRMADVGHTGLSKHRLNFLSLLGIKKKTKIVEVFTYVFGKYSIRLHVHSFCAQHGFWNKL